MAGILNSKIYKVISMIIKVVIVIMILAFVLMTFLQRFSDNKIAFLDFRMFTVVSGSMEPKYMVRDVLLAKEVEPSEIKVGDTVSYLGKAGEFEGKTVTHEVIHIEQDDSGKYYFKTKGIANIVEDPLISEDQMYGKVIRKMALLSFVSGIIGTSVGFYLFIIIPVAFIIVSEVFTHLLEKEARRRETF